MAYAKPKQITGTMPKLAFEHDLQWIFEQLQRCDNAVERRKVCDAYDRVYQDAFDSEAVERKKTGIARRTANLRLLRYIRKKYRVFDR